MPAFDPQATTYHPLLARSIRPLLGIFTAETDTKTLDSAEFVFGAQLPMFGTRVGTDLAQIKLS